MKRVPRLMLICCEGETEKSYLEIVREIYRGPYHLTVKIFSARGQHKALIDKTVNAREGLVGKYCLEQDEIRSWAVCDDDGMTLSFHELLSYAQERSVELAFSRPQFEAYLIQHFEQSKDINQKRLYEKLTKHGHVSGLKGRYEDNKADLRWLEQILLDKPKLIDTAIVNADLRTTQSDKLFLTVQELVKALKEYGI
jgi:hypothetical protein